jgi:hypothetical protein
MRCTLPRYRRSRSLARSSVRDKSRRLEAAHRLLIAESSTSAASRTALATPAPRTSAATTAAHSRSRRAETSAHGIADEVRTHPAASRHRNRRLCPGQRENARHTRRGVVAQSGVQTRIR